MPVVNAPFRLYYAYNPLRLYERPFCNNGPLGINQSCSAQLITRDLFPPGGAGDYTYDRPCSRSARAISSANPARRSA